MQIAIGCTASLIQKTLFVPEGQFVAQRDVLHNAGLTVENQVITGGSKEESKL